MRRRKRLALLGVVVLVVAGAVVGSLFATQGSSEGPAAQVAPSPKELALVRSAVMKFAVHAGERHPVGGRLYKTTIQAAVRATADGSSINPRFDRRIYLAVIHGAFKVDISTPAKVPTRPAKKWPPTFKVAMIQIDPKTGHTLGTALADRLPDLSSLGFWIHLGIPS